MRTPKSKLVNSYSQLGLALTNPNQLIRILQLPLESSPSTHAITIATSDDHRFQPLMSLFYCILAYKRPSFYCCNYYQESIKIYLSILFFDFSPLFFFFVFSFFSSHFFLHIRAMSKASDSLPRPKFNSFQVPTFRYS